MAEGGEMRREGEGAEEVEEFGQEGTWGRGTEVREGGTE